MYVLTIFFIDRMRVISESTLGKAQMWSKNSYSYRMEVAIECRGVKRDLGKRPTVNHRQKKRDSDLLALA